MVSACNADSGDDDDTVDVDETDEGDEGDEGDEAAAGDLIVGTTDTVNSLDPAKIYDYYSSNIIFNAGNTLVGFEPGEAEVSPQGRGMAEDMAQRLVEVQQAVAK